MRGLSKILGSFLLIIMTLIGSGLVYQYVVSPMISSVDHAGEEAVLRYVSDYNETYAVCYVVRGAVHGLVLLNGSWVPGLARRGDLVVVPKTIVWAEGEVS